VVREELLGKLLESCSRLLHQDLELRDPEGRVILAYPSSEAPFLSETEFQDLFGQELSRGEEKRVLTHENRCLLGLPVMRDGSWLGALLISGQREMCSPASDSTSLTESIRLYQVITDFIAKEYTSQLEIHSLSEELAIRYEELNLFYKVSDWLKGVQEADESIHLIVDKITDTLEVDYGFITLPLKEIFAESGSLDNWPGSLSETDALSSSFPFQGHGYLKKLGMEFIRIFSDREFIILDQAHKDRDLKAYFPPQVSLIAVPITMNSSRQGALGIACVLGVRPKRFTTGDVKLLHSMAEVVSILLKNHELYQNLRTFLVSVVKCLVSAIEAKDIYTRGHSERVNHISMLLANHMDLPQNVKESINWASILHDIGKIGIPEAILTKPGKLTDQEYAEIKKHPERGFIILKPIPGFQPALDGVRYHQERYDGRGYPKGLRGKKIPLGARIIAIADTYDAITSDRAYRKGLSHEEAIAEIKKAAGSQLDPDFVNIFLDLVRSKGPQVLRQETIVKNEN